MNESELVLSIRLLGWRDRCYFSDLRIVSAVFVVSPTMVTAVVCLPTTIGSTMLKRNCVDVLIKSIGIHMTDVLAKQAQTNTTAGGARVAPLLNTATQKAIAYGVHVKTKPNTVMTMPDKEKRCSSLGSRSSRSKSVTFQDTTFHFDTFVTEFRFDAMCRFVLHLSQSKVDE